MTNSLNIIPAKYSWNTVLHFEDLGDTSVVSECSLGVNLVIDNFFMWLQVLHLCIKLESKSDYYLWSYCILKIWGIQVLFGCERSCSSLRRVSNFNSNVPQGVSTLISNFKEVRGIFKSVNVIRVYGRTRRRC